MQLYGELKYVDAAIAARDFVTPNAIVDMLSRDARFEVRQAADGLGRDIRSLPSYRREPAALARAVSRVLRYEVRASHGWLAVDDLRRCLQTRVARDLPDSSDLLRMLKEDERRFEVSWWDGQYWARALYKH